jgi:SRSO17 transposase
MAAVTAPAGVAAKHQLLHFVRNAPWSDAAMLAKVGELVLPAIERSGPVEAWIIDDTGFPKKGRHSVGVTRQYCGQLGKQDNCQVAVTLSLANHDASLPIAYQLYLPEDWAKDQARRHTAKVPETIAFQTKPEIALGQIKAVRTAGLPQGVVLMDASYGNDTGLRTEITALGMSYVAGIGPNTSVWPAGRQPLCRRGLDRSAGDPRSDFNAPRRTSRSRSRHSPSAYRKRRGKPSHGAREPRIGSRRTLPGAECGRRIAITC